MLAIFTAVLGASILANALSAVFIFAIMTGSRSERLHGDQRELTLGLRIFALVAPVIGAICIWITFQTADEERRAEGLQQPYSASRSAVAAQ